MRPRQWPSVGGPMVAAARGGLLLGEVGVASFGGVGLRVGGAGEAAAAYEAAERERRDVGELTVAMGLRADGNRQVKGLLVGAIEDAALLASTPGAGCGCRELYDAVVVDAIVDEEDPLCVVFVLACTGPYMRGIGRCIQKMRSPNL